MQIRWWQSIRWRLVLGSMLLVLLVTTLLALSALLGIVHYYGIDESNRLNSFAVDSAQRIGANYTQEHILIKAARVTFPNVLEQSFQGEQFLVVVLNHRNTTVYPHLGRGLSTFSAFAAALADPNLHTGYFAGLSNAIASGQQGVTATGELGGPLSLAHPFIVVPIFAGGQAGIAVVGVLVATPRSAAENTVPPFIAAVGQYVLFASIAIAVLAVLAAILFARTITRPLAKLTEATQVLARGDYSAQVRVNAHGELEELANTFNEMAAKLAGDVNELRRQELWRRELIMNITHDLASPLTAIAGLGDSLVDGVNQNREDYEATGRIIVRETLRLRRLVKDLHMMAKVEAGAIQPQLRAVRLATLIDEVLATLVTEFERANVEPVNGIAYNLPIAYADPDMLTRVFSNLCDNALRHTPPGGTLTINAVPRNGYLEVAVADSGEGIPSEALPRVFERFYRADASRQAITGGSGLGLAIVRAIIEAHGGIIWAENAPRSGARFVFTLPLDVSLPSSISGAITRPIASAAPTAPT